MLLYLTNFPHGVICCVHVRFFLLQLKEWGLICRGVFGPSLGSGDYGHLLIDHAKQLLRKFRSLREYSNQGFESLHKLQRVLYSRATNHDQSGSGSSSKLLCQFNINFVFLCITNIDICNLVSYILE